MTELSFLEAILLGLLQGVTEFLPVSSSGHLVLAEYLLGVHAPDLLSYDILLHTATLLALMTLFWTEVRSLFWTTLMPWRSSPQERGLWSTLLLSTLPLVVLGVLFADAVESFRTIQWVGVSFLFSAALFWLADWAHERGSPSDKPSPKALILSALMQGLALLPGVSRSGSVMAGAMLGGMDRVSAARWSFLLGLPALVAATGYQVLGALSEELSWPPLLPTLIGCAVAYCTALFVARGLLAYFRRYSLRGFSLYLFLLGGVCIFFSMW